MPIAGEKTTLYDSKPLDELRALLASGETASVEFKSTLSDTRRIISAMATIGGGTALVGVRDDGRPVGYEPGHGEVERLVRQVLAATDPRLYVDIDRPEVDGARLLRVRVPAGDGPHLAFGRALSRSGPATVAMTRDEYERRLLDRHRESSGFELRFEPELTFSDVSSEEIARFCTQAAGRMAAPPRPDAPAQVLDRLHLRRGEQITIGAALQSGRDPQRTLPQAVIRAHATRWQRRGRRVHRGQPVSPDRSRVLLRRQEPEDASCARGDDPGRSCRAAARGGPRGHRQRGAQSDYRSVAPIQLRLTDQALTVWNPGHLPAPLTPASLAEDHPSIPPNPHIARALYLAGYIETWGTGTLRVIQTMRAAGNPPPLFEATEGDGLRVTLPMPGAPVPGLAPRIQQALERLSTGRSFRGADYAKLAGVSQRTASLDLGVAEGAGLIRGEGVGRASRWVRVR